MADELRDHLHEAAAEGRDIEEVVGHDLASFASSWAQAEYPTTARGVMLQIVGTALLVPGLALLNPLFGRGPTGVPLDVLAYVVPLTAGIMGAQLVRRRRFQLTSQQAAWAQVVALGGGAVLAVTLQGAVRDRDVFFAIPPVAAWTFLVAALLCQGAYWWLRRSRR